MHLFNTHDTSMYHETRSIVFYSVTTRLQAHNQCRAMKICGPLKMDRYDHATMGKDVAVSSWTFPQGNIISFAPK